MKSTWAIVLPFLAMACGCARYKYHPAPVSPPVLATSLEARSLDDAGLRTWMKQAAHYEPPAWPIENWDLNALTLAAYYFNPDMDVARANAAVADAAITTAAMKPNPSVGVSGGYETTPESPYLFGLNFSLPIETAGKRGYRIAEATHLSEASQFQVAETAWTVRSQVRAAFVDLLFAEGTFATVQQQESVQSRYVDLLDARLRAGEIPLPDVTAARIDLANLRQALRAAEGQIGTARAGLAAAVGVPASSFSNKTVTWADAEQPPTPEALPPRAVRTTAVENRLDVQRALAQYEAAQSRLQLEVARQYPDIDVGPGYAFEEGTHLISLQLATMLPFRNRNEGPISEAEAQRKAAGAQLLATQTAVISQTDKALAQYHAAYSVLEQAQRTVAQAEAQRRTAEQWLKSGEADQLTAVSADLQEKTAKRSRLDALHQAQSALGPLEDALQRPIAPGTAPALPQKAPR